MLITSKRCMKFNFFVILWYNDVVTCRLDSKERRVENESRIHFRPMVRGSSARKEGPSGQGTSPVQKRGQSVLGRTGEDSRCLPASSSWRIAGWKRRPETRVAWFIYIFPICISKSLIILICTSFLHMNRFNLWFNLYRQYFLILNFSLNL